MDFSKILNTLRADKPLIKLILGNACIAAGTYELIRSSDDIHKVNQYVRDRKEEMDLVDHDSEGWGAMDETRSYYILTTVSHSAKEYVKAAGLGVGFIFAGTVLGDTSYADLSKEVTSLSASLAITSTAFNQYRERVIRDHGEEKDFEYYTGAVNREIVDVDKDGNVTTKHETIKINNGTVIPHSFMFDESNDEYIPGNIEHSLNILSTGIDNVNLILHTNKWGMMTENEMRKCFGAEPVIQGQSAGAFARDKDGYEQSIRLNPKAMERLLNGEDSAALCILEYSDGRPLENDIFKDYRNSWRLV